jgi:hypothetical protein
MSRVSREQLIRTCMRRSTANSSIGDEAEDLAQLWGTRAGFVVHPVRRDRCGWDHLFEMRLPRKPRTSNLPDLPTRAFTCRIQVKGIGAHRRSIPIKLTNWMQAIDDPLPWFFLVVRFHVNSTREVTLAHVDKAQVTRVLQRLATTSNSPVAPPHKRTLALRLSDGTILPSPVDQALLTAIARTLGPDAFEYAKTKRAWSQSVSRLCHTSTQPHREVS